jgi:hypothetical protein
MDVVQMKKYAPWMGVALLVIIVLILLQRFRSKYTPPTGNVITMMDLQEFSAFSQEQKSNYVSKLEASQDKLRLAASTNSFTNYRIILDEIMNSIVMPPEQMCQPGTYSTTGRPLCMPCPSNTYCPSAGMTVPTPCPAETTSVAGATSCMQMDQTQTMCQPGTYSTNGRNPCIPCPVDTYCPTAGTISPTPCPTGTTSMDGSVACAKK